MKDLYELQVFVARVFRRGGVLRHEQKSPSRLGRELLRRRQVLWGAASAAPLRLQIEAALAADVQQHSSHTDCLELRPRAIPNIGEFLMQTMFSEIIKGARP
jgi:hypothetical protein